MLADVVARDLPRDAEGGGKLVDAGVDGVHRVAPGPGLAEFLGVDGDAVGGAVVREAEAVAVEDAAARGRKEDAADALADLRRLEVVRLLHLEGVEAGDERPEGPDDEEREDEEAPAGHVLDRVRHVSATSFLGSVLPAMRSIRRAAATRAAVARAAKGARTRSGRKRR